MCDAKSYSLLAFLRHPKDDIQCTRERQRGKVSALDEKKRRQMEKSKSTFQNDKIAIYEFIYIDHIVFIFTASEIK